MKVIDIRVRPPFRSFSNAPFFDVDNFLEAFNANYGMTVSQSVREKSMELCIKEMDEVGIELAVVPLRKSWGIDNDDLKALQEAYPGRFMGFAGIELSKGIEASLNEIDKSVTNGSCKGIAMEPGLDTFAYFVDDPRVYPIYEKCQAENIIIFFTWGGLLAPDMRYYDPHRIDYVARDFPNLKIVLCHAGWPFASEICSVAINRPNVYLGIDLYIVNAPGGQDYITAANYRLKDKILFGSAYPFMGFKEGVEYYKNCGFREEVLPNVMYHNAARLLGLESK